MKKILLHPKLKHQIKDELKCTLQTVDMSLRYVFKSDNADLIRKRAKELLTEEAQKIEL